MSVVAALLALPLPALAHSTVGLVDPGDGYWRLLQTDGTISGFYYGNPGDVPFLGDWDCDGIDTPGLYRRSDGYAYLRNSNTEGVADIRFFFGNPGDHPVPGDFDGDGCDTLSLYRGSEGRFYIVNELGADEAGLGVADYWYDFGDAGDLPIAGDFDGDGRDEVGLARDGLLLYEDALVPNSSGGAADHAVALPRGSRPVAGDWAGDGVETPAVFDPAAPGFTFPLDDGRGPDGATSWGEGDWIPVSGRIHLPASAASDSPAASEAGAQGAAEEAVSPTPPPDDGEEPAEASETVETGSDPAAAPGDGAQTVDGLPFLRPLDAPVTQYYGWRLHPIYLEWIFHYGWDFEAECGVPIAAPSDAVVIWAGWMDDRTGNAVRLDHGNGLVSSYAHLSEIGVDLGDRVAAGDRFALVGTTGDSTGCHLHFGVREDWSWIDPEIVLCPALGAPSVPYDRDGCPDGE